MKLTDRLKLASKSLFSSQPPTSSGMVVRNYGKQAEFRPQEQLKGITYKAIEKIATASSVYEPIVKRGDGEAYQSHPLLSLYENPNPRMLGSDFTQLWTMQFKIYGETFWYLARGESSNKIKEIYQLDPSRMQLIINDGELVGYVLHKTNGQQLPLEIDEVYHHKTPNPFNEWRGMSLLEKAATYVDIELKTTDFTLSYISNAGSPSGIVSLPSMDQNTFKIFAQQWRENYEGPENAGKTAFVRGGGVDFKAVGSTLQDIDQKITREMAKEDVLMMLDVPKGLISGSSQQGGLGRNELEPLEYLFAKWTIEPLFKSYDNVWEYIGRQNQSGRENSISVSHKNIIPDDKNYRLEMYEKGINKWLTANEIRAEMGLDPIDGGDELNTTNTSPIVQASKKVVLKKKEDKDPEQYRQSIVDKNEIYETKFYREMKRFAGKQEKETISRLKASSKAYEEILFEIKEQSEQLYKLLIPIAVELMEEQGKNVVHYITGEVLTITPEMKAIVEARILKISGLYNEQTLKALEATITEGRAANESIASIKKRIESVYSEAKGYRAERIARTESLKISNLTAEMVYKENGFEKKKWFVNPGACEFCQQFSGKEVTIGTNFAGLGDVITLDDGKQLAVDYDDIADPPLHPNCKCSILPV